MKNFILDIDRRSGKYNLISEIKTPKIQEKDGKLDILFGFVKNSNSYHNNINDLKKINNGLFARICVNTINKSIEVETDHVSSKALFYYASKKLVVLSNNPLKIARYLKSRYDISIEIEKEAILSMLSFGYLIEPMSFFKNILRFKRNSITYFKVKNSSVIKKPEENTSKRSYKIDKISKLFANALAAKLNLIKDNKVYFYLSGGLDSRYVCMEAKKMGFTVKALNFGEKDCDDLKLAKTISQKENFELEQIELDQGNYLLKVSDYFEANGGQVCFLSAAHLVHAVKESKYKNYKYAVSGLIGDVVFGSNVKTFDIKDYVYSIDAYKKSKIFKDLNFRNAEDYFLELKGPCAIMNGDTSILDDVISFSPFLDPDVFYYCRGIDDKYKKNSGLYFDLVRNKLTDVGNYVWQKSGIKPKNIFLNTIFSKLKWLYTGILRRLSIKTSEDMNPFNYWYKNNQKLSGHIKQYQQKIAKLSSKNILIELIKKESTHLNFRRKCNAITCYLALLEAKDDNNWK